MLTPSRLRQADPSSHKLGGQKAIFANLVILPCTGSFPCDPENASGKNRCRSRRSASLRACSILRTCLSACCSRSFFLVLQRTVFAALAVASYIVPQKSGFVRRRIN